MKTAYTIEQRNNKKLFRVFTATVFERLTEPEIHEAFTQLHEKMKTPHPENPNLWVVNVDGYKLWGILDPGAGPAREDVLTLLFPEDY